MKKPALAPAAPAPMPQGGGSYIRLKDGTLQREEATDNTPESIAAAREAAALAEAERPVEAPVNAPLNAPVKEA